MADIEQYASVSGGKFLSTALLTFVVCGCATTQKQTTHVYAIDIASMSGEFESQFIAQSPTPGAETVTKDMQIRLLLSHGTARVFMLERAGWEEKKPGRFRIESLGPNAIIRSIDDGRTPNGGPWVETWIVAITARTPDELLMRWVRLVNNTETPLSNPDSKYTFDGEGVLKRVAAKDYASANVP